MEATATIQDAAEAFQELYAALDLLCACHKCEGSFLDDLLKRLSGHKPFRDLRCDTCLCKRTHAWLEPDLFAELCAQGRIPPIRAARAGADPVLP